MLVLAIWLFLAGYTIAITGKRNLGLGYQPQADGSIKAVDDQGNPAKAYSLLDVIQCQDASLSLQGQPAPLGAAKSSRPAGEPPPLNTNRMPELGPSPLPNPNLQVPAPRPRPPIAPEPAPAPLPGLLNGLTSFERSLEQDVYHGLNSAASALRSVLGGLHLPGIRVPGLQAARPLP